MKTYSTIGNALIKASGIALFVAALAGCNTLEGIGEDVEEAGDRVEDATDSV